MSPANHPANHAPATMPPNTPAANPANPPLWEVDAALEHMLAAVPPVVAESVALDQALHRVLAEEVLATVALPGFDNSAMDGYALGPGAAPSGSEWLLTGEQPAAASRHGSPLKPGETWRIFTGAPVPPGTMAVAMQEDVESISATKIRLTTAVEPGEFIRRAGSDVCLGQVLLHRGRQLNAFDLGLLASQGRTEVPVHRRPSVHIISTGDECRPPGQALAPGEIHESNGLMLAAMAAQAGADPANLTRQHVGDHRQSLRRACADALQQADLLVISGGVSVGQYDHVRPVLEELGCATSVHKLRMKPGKPSVFARHPSGRLVFGLPGNPVSSAVTFHLLVAPVIRAALGLPTHARHVPGQLGEAMENRGDRPHYLRVRIAGPVASTSPLPTLTTAGRQSSDALGGLARSDGLLRIETGERIESGATVSWLPW